MDDSNILYYIVLAVIYVLSRVLKKKKPESAKGESSEEGGGDVSNRPVNQPSFEDLFKQITGESLEEKKHRVDEPIEPVGYSDDIEEVYDPEPAEEPVLSDYVYKEDQQTKRSVGSVDRYARNSNFAIEAEDNEEGDKIRALLQDEDGVRQAMILKEVLDRKY
ncbi:hypothetical protein BFP72_05060 [Reichenbachiella sp. 5M10]|uniref:hypothetical protein n=1 Tax=Reichenbachiella sp. 5M10 TaxID=1889772 RepID=UPI000C145136|nr:hypothetical protein [Reichenbachiella sp. 5M10]PIB34817.1 hypothetical protein BFP72_05060 [Reichenbachiella sp. 5M10]